VTRGRALCIRSVVSLLGLGGDLLSCASSPATSEPPRAPRPPQVAGLEPLAETAPTDETASSANAAGSASSATSAISDRQQIGRQSVPAGSIVLPTGQTCGARVGDRGVKRSALGRTLDAGLGTWLRGIDVEAKLERGHFQGWLVRSLYDGDPCWADVDLRAGDIVTRINRRPIERPEQAQIVWTGLRASHEIVVDYLRDGRPRTLTFSVVEAPD
jgi:S1-C subfamily serine protease